MKKICICAHPEHDGTCGFIMTKQSGDMTKKAKYTQCKCKVFQPAAPWVQEKV